MGVVYSVAFTLVSATPYHLRYLMEDTGQPGSTTMANAGTAPVLPDTADLRYNALTAAGQGAGGLPLYELLNTGVQNQASARHSLLADATTNSPNPANLARANCDITQKVLAANGFGWSVDADLGAGGSAGYPVLTITPPGGGDGIAYLDIHLEHSISDGPDGVGG